MKKMMKHQYNFQDIDWKIALADFLILLSMTIFLWWFMNLALISTKQIDESIKIITQNSEYVITQKWSDEEDCDVDIWIKDPNNRYVSFQKKDEDFINIDRDAKGHDSEMGPDSKMYSYTGNLEVVNIRKTMIGDYYVNTHLYNCNIIKGSMQHDDPKVLSTTVEMYKLKPTVTKIFSKSITFQKIWEEQTVLHFKTDVDGNYTYIDDKYVPMISEKAANATYSGSGIPY